MNDLLVDPLLYLGLGLIVLLPAVILALGEMRSRMARSGSRLYKTVSYTRSWVVPVLALWAVLVVIAGITRNLVPVRFLETLLIAVTASASLKLFRALFVETDADGKVPSWRGRIPGLLLAAPRILLIGFAVYLVAGIWGLDVSQAFAALGVGSLVIALALQDTLSGLVSGFLLMADRPFQPGDWIEAGDVEGRVVDVRWRTVRVRTRQNTLIVVPNAVLAGEVISNRSAPEPIHRMDVDFDIAFSNSPTAARAMLLRAVEQTDGILRDPAPVVTVTRVDDPLMGYQVQAWVASYEFEPKIMSELRDRVWYQSQRDDVPLPSPAFDLFHWDGVATAASGVVTPEQISTGLLSARVVRSLPEVGFEQLVASSRQLTYARGELILPSGDIFPDLFIVGDGEAVLFIVDESGEERVFDDLGPGDLFGLVPLTDLDVAVGVRAVGDCAIYRAPRSDVFSLLTRHGEIADELTRLGVIRTRRAARVVSPTDLDDWLVEAAEATAPAGSNGQNGVTPAPSSAPGTRAQAATAVIDLRDSADGDRLIEDDGTGDPT